MISTRCLVNKLRELGYTFKDRRHRVDLWRKEGGTHIVTLPRKNQLSEITVRLLPTRFSQGRRLHPSDPRRRPETFVYRHDLPQRQF